jgi:DNA-binding transcriptional regulator YdaS (Cro superfamily)
MSPDRTAVADSVARACTESAGTVQALAEEVGVSYAALCSWSRGRRRPPPHRLETLASVLDDRAERLRSAAQALRQLAGEADGNAAAGTPDSDTAGLPLAPTADLQARIASLPAPGAPISPQHADRNMPLRRPRPGGIPLPPLGSGR